MSDFREIRLEKAKALKELGQEPYALRFQTTHHAASLQLEHKDLPNGEERLVDVSVAGRVMSRRVMGKLAFFGLVDESGTLQLYLEKSTIDSNSAEIPGQSSFSQLTDQN